MCDSMVVNDPRELRDLPARGRERLRPPIGGLAGKEFLALVVSVEHRLPHFRAPHESKLIEEQKSIRSGMGAVMCIHDLAEHPEKMLSMENRSDLVESMSHRSGQLR